MSERLFSPHSDAVRLIFDSITHVAGDSVVGRVELDIQRIRDDRIEQLRVKLRGVATVVIVEDNYAYTSSTTLLREDLILWAHGTDAACGSPPDGSRITQLPFVFSLPTDLPSSFHIQTSGQSATISYAVEVVADRPGLFRLNRRIASIFPVIPIATDAQASAASLLSQGWTGKTSKNEKTTQIRKRLWGGFSRVHATLERPALPSLPVGVPIPIGLTISTYTKPMLRSETPVTMSELFPAPPTCASGLKIYLDSHIRLRAEARRACIDRHICEIGGFGVSTDSPPNQSELRVIIDDPVWIPESEEAPRARGIWKRAVRFATTIVLTCSPTLQVMGMITCDYSLYIEVPFPGLGNNFQWRIPIHINSGFGTFDPDAPPPAPPPDLDLPPMYFSGEYHNWDGDMKT